MKEAGNGYYLKQFIWDKIAPSAALTTAAWVMKQIGADMETPGSRAKCSARLQARCGRRSK